MACPHLEYRRESDDHAFETERAYCTVADRFVQPMRADICTERYGLDPASDCEIYREAAGLAWDASDDADARESGGNGESDDGAGAAAASGEATASGENGDRTGGDDERGAGADGGHGGADG